MQALKRPSHISTAGVEEMEPVHAPEISVKGLRLRSGPAAAGFAPLTETSGTRRAVVKKFLRKFLFGK
jgi:hypothetical protein